MISYNTACLFTIFCFMKICCFPDVWLTISRQYNAANNIPNRGSVRLAALGTLICTTVYRPCCSTPGQGGWYYPNGSVVPPAAGGATLFTSRSGQGYIGLNQRNNFRENGLNVDGVYSCEVPDASGMNDTLYVGIYSGPVCKLFLYVITLLPNPNCRLYFNEEYEPGVIVNTFFIYEFACIILNACCYHVYRTQLHNLKNCSIYT